MPRMPVRFLLLAVPALTAACSPAVAPEPAPPPPDAVIQWIDSTATPLATVEPSADDTDLTPLLAMLGNARVIGLGEATHGTHEFFTMKDRVLRYLVEHDSVTALAIEATMPEAFALDRYVRTGQGNPAVLLSHLYFWTWNTDEVFDLITWLRTYDIAHPQHQVGFYGFDMQYPGVAIDSVLSYVTRVAPTLADTIRYDYDCLSPYRNNDHGVFAHSYLDAGVQVWTPCRLRVGDAFGWLSRGKADLIAASSAAEYEMALQMARVVLQWEDEARGGPESGVRRDNSMAENVNWLLEREGSAGKLVLWAHDYHISRQSLNVGPRQYYSMGGLLAAQGGASYVPVGFAFASGSFNAVEILSNNSFAPVKPFTAAPLTGAGSYEEAFEMATPDNFLLDLRQRSADVDDWMRGPHPFRTIGCCYAPTQPQKAFAPTSLTSQFDVLVFISQSSPSELRPFTY